jgi:hypothetical protein
MMENFTTREEDSNKKDSDNLPVTMTTLELWCYFIGEDISQIFPVRIADVENVHALKIAIKKEKRNVAYVPVQRLDLHRISVTPEDREEKLKGLQYPVSLNKDCVPLWNGTLSSHFPDQSTNENVVIVDWNNGECEAVVRHCCWHSMFNAGTVGYRYEDVDLIIDGIYLGNWQAAKSPYMRSAFGITHILSACPNVSIPSVENLLRFPINDDEDENILVYLPKAFQFIQKSLDEGGRVLVHCWAGVSRSSTIVCAYSE